MTPMRIETRSMHVTKVGGNVFADLGFAPAEAAALQAESKRVIAEKFATKGAMMTDQAHGCDTTPRRNSTSPL